MVDTIGIKCVFEKLFLFWISIFHYSFGTTMRTSFLAALAFQLLVSVGSFLTPSSSLLGTPYGLLARTTRGPQLRNACLLRMQKWEGEVEDEMAERMESVKAGVLSGVAGSIAAVPVALVQTEEYFPFAAFTPQWELQIDGLALSLGLFGLVYRYAVRRDPNPQLKQGVVGAFAITRTWAMLKASATCTAVPLQCGPPLGYFNWEMITQVHNPGPPPPRELLAFLSVLMDMLLQGSGLAVENALAFGAAAAALELAFARGWLKPFSSVQ